MHQLPAIPGGIVSGHVSALRKRKACKCVSGQKIRGVETLDERDASLSGDSRAFSYSLAGRDVVHQPVMKIQATKSVREGSNGLDVS